MKIYFDDVLINEDYYVEIKQSHKLFTDTFKLGGIASNTFDLKLDKRAVSSIPNKILFKENDVDYAYVKVDSYDNENDNFISYKLADAMVDLNASYDASEIIENSATGYVTTLEILKDICAKFGLELENQNFINDDILVNYYDNTKTAREYVSYIAELNGGYAIINESGKLELKQFNNNSVQTINIDMCENFKVGQKYSITRLVYNGIEKFESGNTTGTTIYINEKNPYIQSQKIIDKIFTVINGFEFYNFKTSNCPIVDAKVGEIISFFDGTNYYPTIVQKELNYNCGWTGGYELEITADRVEETKIVGVNKKVQKLEIEVNRGNAELKIIAESTNQIQNELGDIYTKEQINELIQNAETGLTNTFTKIGGNNLLRNTGLYFKTNDVYDYWTGNVEKKILDESASGTSMLLKAGSLKQSLSLANGTYSVGFKYRRLNPLGNASVKYNGRAIVLDEEGEIKTTGEITTNSFEIEIVCDINNSYEIWELMLNKGSESAVWSQSANEVHTDTVNISKGVTVEATENDTKATLGADGLNVVNKITTAKVLKATDTGIETTDVKATTGTIGGLMLKKVGNQTIGVGI